jgi:hypothetical protein
MMSDTFRKEYKSLSQLDKDNISGIKDGAQILEEIFDDLLVETICDKRCMELAKVNLEQAVMWAVKAIT